MQLAEILSALQGLPEDQRARVTKEALAATKDLKWIPNPGPQSGGYWCDADELFFGGEAGGGKSDLGVGLALTAHHRSLILREFNEDARSLGDRLLEIVGSNDGWNGQLLRYSNGGRLIEFAGVPNEKDKQRHKGDPHDLIVFDEVGDFYESQFDFIIGWNRSTKEGQRCRVVATGNPPTRAKGLWVIRRWGAWLDPKHPRPAKPGELRWYTRDEGGKEIEVDGPGPHLIGKEMVRAKSRTFIRSRLSDNPDLAKTDYAANLSALPKELRDAYRDGKFDASLKDAPFQVMPTAWIRAAQERWTDKPLPNVPMCSMGVDASGGGEDPMVIAPRYDGWYPPLIKVNGKDIPVDRIGKHCAGIVISHRLHGAKVIVDMGGGYGGPVYETLIENIGSDSVLAYKGAEASTRRTKDQKLGFYNKRSQACWQFREALDPSQEGGSPIALPDDSELVADLAALTFEVTSRGIKVISKENVCELLGRSTDSGDAVIMAWYDGARAMTHAQVWSKENGRGRREPSVNYGPRRSNGMRKH